MIETRTTCAYCGVGCGIRATPTGPRAVTIKGDPDHPANFGRLCSKGTHLGETIGLEGRLLYPEINQVRVDWNIALDHVASRFQATIAEHGPESVAFYVSGQLLTEDYYVANKLMKGFIGTANIDTNSRLCMASAVAAHNRAFGEDVVPCSYDDLEKSDLIILVGSNTAWCHPVIWQRIEAAREKRGTKLVVIDPRRTETAERADLHLAIAPDGDVALFNALLLHLHRNGGLDEAFLGTKVNTPDDFWAQLTAGDCGVDQAALDQFFALFAAHPRTVTLFSQGANQSTSGTDKGNAIINLHLATGRIGQPGMGPFSITGQPNAMGGREVGGLASMLAVHMGFSAAEQDRAQRFWQSPNMCSGPGLKAVEMFDAVAAGKIKAIWIMATNPAVSMPDAGDVRAALANCPLVVVSDCIAETDTTAFAHVKLPALGWGEKDGTVTNSERRISRQRGFLAPAGEARPDWWIIAQVAQRMGWADAFDFPNAASIFREFAAQTGFENQGARVLDIGDYADISDVDYDALEPFVWGGASPFADRPFTTSNGKANLVLAKPAQREADPAFPFRLNTGRYRDQWHTMTRTGLSPKLSQHRREPLVEIHPDDAQALHIQDGGLAEVATPHGASIYRVSVTDGQRRGELFVPMHWTDQFSSAGRTGLLPGKDRDPVSGQPGFKNTPAIIASVAPDWSGFLVTQTLPDAIDLLYHTKVRTPAGWLIELAGMGDADAALALLPSGERAEVVDARRGTIRAAVIGDGHLQAALFIARDGSLPPRDWLVAQLSMNEASSIELLAGRSATPAPDRGAIICVCFDVGMMTILDAISAQSLTSVEAVGAALNAGTNCGSCRPAIARLLSEKELING
ncbi:molybdopterin-dependent oxidoreductase [Aquisediminimonas sediminicola]|uniref:molybdopterin-dependent oxidoreductase n=1 Tax=Alteraquisediminimonas sediminicola TaxID=2676787 RepID=UPI001C8EE57D